jgi:hypothetical protein
MTGTEGHTVEKSSTMSSRPQRQRRLTRHRRPTHGPLAPFVRERSSAPAHPLHFTAHRWSKADVGPCETGGNGGRFLGPGGIADQLTSAAIDLASLEELLPAEIMETLASQGIDVADLGPAELSALPGQTDLDGNLPDLIQRFIDRAA